VQLTRHDTVVEVRLNVGIGHLLERDRPLAAKADQVEEAVTAPRHVGAALHELGEPVLELLLELAALLRGDSRQLVTAEAFPQALERFRVLNCHQSAPWL